MGWKRIKNIPIAHAPRPAMQQSANATTLAAERVSDLTAPEDSPPQETPERPAVSQEEALLAGRRIP